jgi:hypothetical protein
MRDLQLSRPITLALSASDSVHPGSALVREFMKLLDQAPLPIFVQDAAGHYL